MKTRLFVILAAAGLSAAAQSNTNSGTGTMSSSLDGKVFMVTLTSQGGSSSDQDRRDNMDRKENKSSSTSSGMSTSETDRGMKEGKKMMLRFENGMLRTTAKGDLKVENCRYNTTGSATTASTGSSVSFTADCSSSMPMKDGSGRSSSDTRNSGTGAANDMKTGDNTGISGATNTGTTTGTGMTTDDRTGTGTTGTGTQSGTGRTSDDRSTTTGTGTASGNYDRSGTTGRTSGTGSDDMAYESEQVKINGTVNGDSINGTLTCTKKNGKTKTYSFTGSKATKQDLDMEGTLGMN